MTMIALQRESIEGSYCFNTPKTKDYFVN